MLRFHIRTLIIVIAICAVGLASCPWPRRVTTTSLEDLSRKPALVQSIIGELSGLRDGSSLEQFELELNRLGNIEVPYAHHKDFEFYWSINSDSPSTSQFIIAANFTPSENAYRLTHAHIIEASAGSRRTIWLADYGGHQLLPPRIRRQSQPSE